MSFSECHITQISFYFNSWWSINFWLSMRLWCLLLSFNASNIFNKLLLILKWNVSMSHLWFNLIFLISQDSFEFLIKFGYFMRRIKGLLVSYLHIWVLLHSKIWTCYSFFTQLLYLYLLLYLLNEILLILWHFNNQLFKVFNRCIKLILRRYSLRCLAS